MTFGEKFKAEREKRKLTQQEVADALGINRRMITRYENGISFPRTKDAYRKIAEYFKVDVNYLLTEDEEFVVQASEQYGSRGMKHKNFVSKFLQTRMCFFSCLRRQPEHAYSNYWFLA